MPRTIKSQDEPRAPEGTAASPAPARKLRTAKRVVDLAARRARSSATPLPAVETAAAATEDLREEIARLAYALWEARGRQHGSAEEDWYRAEGEALSGRRASRA